MSIPSLSNIGEFLVGNTEEQPGWLQSVHSSVSSLGDFLALGLGQRLVLLQAKYVQGKKILVPAFQDAVSVLEEEEVITSILCFPVVNGKGATSTWNCTICGFSSGQVRIYTDTGKLLVQKAFHPTPVKQVKVQAMPDGKHFTNVLHSQTVQEVVIVYATMVVTVSGTDLYQTLKDNMSHLAQATAHGLQFSQLTALPGMKLLVPEQVVSDCESLVQQNTSYTQYLSITMKGGLVDERHKPIHTSPIFISAGLNPFLQYHDRSPQYSTNPVALVQNMASTVKSGFYRLWGAKEEPDQPKPDPEATLSICHSIKDEGRSGLEIFLSPNKIFSAVKDEKNRVMVVDNISGTLVQAWRGYHRCQVAWAVTSWAGKEGEIEPGSDVQVSVILLLYLPRRGLIEVWSPEQKSKITEFHVSKHGLLLRSTLACLDDGIPRRREVLSLYCAFLQPSGVINQFYIPFHALTTSSSAERDYQLQASLQEQLMSDIVDLEKLVEKVVEVRNPQLRSHIVSDIITGESKLKTAMSAEFLGLLMKTFSTKEENISIDNKLFRSKVWKLSSLSSFYYELVKPREFVNDMEGGTKEERLCLELMTDLEEVRILLDLVGIKMGEEEMEIELSFPDFLSCFETEGDLSSAKDGLSIHLKKNIPPRVAVNLFSAVATLISQDTPSALDQFNLSGLHTEDIMQLLLTATMHQMENTVTGVRKVFQTMNFLLNLNANVDDRHRSSMQELVRKVLRKQDMNQTIYLVATVWKCVLVASNCQAVAMYAEDWVRKLQQISSFLQIKELYIELLEEQIQSVYTISGVFECGNGRVSEILARWLVKLGADGKSLVNSMESMEENKIRQLIEKSKNFFPHSSNQNILLIHVCWEHMQSWTRDRDNLTMVEVVVWSCWSLSCPLLRAKFLALVWRTFFEQLLRDCARMTETLAKSITNKDSKCLEVLQMKADSVAGWLTRLSDLLDCQLQTLTLTGESDMMELQYDILNTESQAHLLDHTWACPVPDMEVISLEHQLAMVLDLTWTLKLHLRPLQLFNTAETTQLLNTQPGLMSSIFTDHNVAVNKARVVWLGVATEAAVGHIHQVPGEGRQYDMATFHNLSEKLLQLGKVWFMSDLVRVCQVDSLYRAGYDDLASELRTSVTDLASLSDRLLEVCLLRLAKHVWCSSTDSQGRLAAVPPALITQLADRKQASAGVAEAGMVDTVALLAWAANMIEDTDRHSLATQALAAGQVLQVRNNRTSGGGLG